MKIKIDFVNDPSIQGLLSRFYGVADSKGISRDEAERQALVLWLESWADGGRGLTLEVTEKEGKLILAALEVLREGRAAL